LTFSVDKEVISSALNLVSSCITSVKTQPILHCVMLEGSGLSVKATTTDLDMIVSTEFLSVVEQDFKVCVPYKQLLSLVKLLSKDEVSFELGDSVLIVKSGRSRHKLPLYRVEEFPQPEVATVKYATLPAKLLKEMMSCGHIAAAKDNSGAWMLTCVSVKTKENNLAIRSSDGHQVALASTPVTVLKEMECLVPISAVTAILKVADCGGEAVIAGSENDFSVTTERGFISTRLMAGKFPNVEMIIPSQYDKRFQVKVKDFILLCKRAALSSGPKGDVWCTFSHNTVLVQSQDPIKGESEESMVLTGSEESTEPVEIGLRCDHVEHGLSRFDGDVSIEVKDKVPVRFSPLEADFDFQYLTVPLRKVNVQAKSA